MSDPPQPPVPPGGFGFGPGGFGGFGGFDLEAVLRMVQGQGPLNWEMATQVAGWVAAQGADDAPPDPGAAEMLLDLARTAQMHVHEATGLAAGLQTPVRAGDRATFAAELLEGLKPVLTRLAERLGTPGPGEPETEGPEDAFVGLVGALAPLLLGVQAGFMTGHLAQHCTGRYELPLPLADRAAVSFVVPNVTRFERDWQLPAREARFFFALHEALHATLRSVPWLHERLLHLSLDYVGAFEVDQSIVEERFGAIDPTDPSTFEVALGNPSELLGAMRSPAQEVALEHLRTTTALVEGYVDHVLEVVGSPLITEFARIREAAHRHRVERGEAERFVETLLGLDLGREHYERGAAFCRGVVERAGEEGLRRLWERRDMLPTPAEFEAPGLWLARIELPDA